MATKEVSVHDKRNDKSVDQLLFQQLKECKNLKEVIVREDLISGFTARLMARSLSEEMGSNFESIEGEGSKYFRVVMK